MPYSYKYPRPALTVDCVIFGYDTTKSLQVLLIQRKSEPFKDSWALPGGFVEMEEDLETAALRELAEETGIKEVFIEQLYTFGTPNRDPRGRVISVAYYALVNSCLYQTQAATDAKQVKWFDIDNIPSLAFDHPTILERAIQRLRAKVRYQPIGFELLPEQFTLSELQQLYESILGVEQLNKRNFRSKILKMGVLQEVGIQEGVAHRPALLYSFDKEKYKQLSKANEATLLKRGPDFDI